MNSMANMMNKLNKQHSSVEVSDDLDNTQQDIPTISPPTQSKYSSVLSQCLTQGNTSKNQPR